MSIVEVMYRHQLNDALLQFTSNSMCLCYVYPQNEWQEHAEERSSGWTDSEWVFGAFLIITHSKQSAGQLAALVLYMH